ncbi:cupin domain-containing protein [Mesorhizobium sp.]|uniref:cupin domain-containing protein n=1 Tax=Mesorhizobium sp. TaxID=1871066 RepID=UPI0025C60B93|nr:cupin domain-containing protein [Mesorhizobium sp.]
METQTIRLNPAPPFPNSALPVILYRNCFTDSKELEHRLRSNGWIPDWYSAEGMFPYHHFHSDAHEIIAVLKGKLRGKVGGPDGVEVVMGSGDVIVLPAGVAHIGLAVSADLWTVGGYPSGYAIHDFRLGDMGEYANCLANTLSVPSPAADPLGGLDGPLAETWR